MTIPRNFADLANNVDSNGTLGVAGGGTGVTSVGTSGNVLTSNGTVWTSSTPAPSGKAANVQTFTSSGTWTKPTGFGASARVYIQVWGAGGSGGKGAVGGGGGGGAYNETWYNLSALGATETITIGAGGTGKTIANTPGTAGGNSSVGSKITAYGGGGGVSVASGAAYGGAGGGQLSAGADGSASAPAPGAPYILMGGIDSNTGVQLDFSGTNAGIIKPQGFPTSTSPVCGGGALTYPTFMHGGGGGTGGALTYAKGNNSVWGGGGGAGNFASSVGGTSSFGGSGGGGGTTASGTAGTQPAGGGGATTTGTTSGAGGAGQIIITVFDGA